MTGAGQDLYEAALQFMNEGDDYLVVSHVQPDGDAVSSTLAASWLLGKLGKKAVLANEDLVPDRLRFMAGSEGILRYGDNQGRTFKRIIAVDCADFKRIGRIAEWFEDGYELLNIDHHPTNNGYGAVNLVVPDAAATAQILYGLVRTACMPLEQPAAEMLYTGLLTDTGGFRYSNTDTRVMQAASELLEAGAGGHAIADRLLERMSLPQLKLLRLGLNRMEFHFGDRVCTMHISPEDMQETGAAPEDLEGLVNYARNVEGVDAGILFKGLRDGGVKASLRSGGTLDVAAIASRFGGGGHIRAAGCRLDGPIGEAMSSLLAVIREELKD
ncbi:MULTISPECIES: bifunctional oligoribonuclease/PAP phosphatase NrnA [unclassified Paenibacillus]|uniref:DHH family phosphoesterase n=1 Tax=unclassified Paenibacillus TaxID=185978 RepID=UPI0009549138|nr:MULTISPECIES: bifunctional oligoribonuclease/PAP phosphatase NrnA [unclassified Paenibacillus]ASS65672.1 bifunctional oligoribonuclease/PAP phosphatase NrnA [Paenibacillus sp. RUD330]SIQ27689.1 phosphoesterase RecJ domain-containing protein [Paenibacillus sp. RU4X]SIQ49991.1 phosphoesterase RecJ domain-containing protein [Paenibacillus sp. RU4T]